MDKRMDQCRICGRKYIYNRRSGGTRTKCNSCMVNERRFKLTVRMLEYKGNSCVLCGYSKCKQSMDFHHIRDKKFAISGSHCRSWNEIKEELDKCVLLCRNCHGELHAGLISIPEGAETRRQEPNGIANG